MIYKARVAFLECSDRGRPKVTSDQCWKAGNTVDVHTRSLAGEPGNYNKGKIGILDRESFRSSGSEKSHHLFMTRVVLTDLGFKIVRSPRKVSVLREFDRSSWYKQGVILVISYAQRLHLP